MRRTALMIKTVKVVTDDGQKFCRNCGDPFDREAGDAACRLPVVSWRPCPNPSPGRPLVDCGVGGHMYTDRDPRID